MLHLGSSIYGGRSLRYRGGKGQIKLEPSSTSHSSPLLLAGSVSKVLQTPKVEYPIGGRGVLFKHIRLWGTFHIQTMEESILTQRFACMCLPAAGA